MNVWRTAAKSLLLSGALILLLTQETRRSLPSDLLGRRLGGILTASPGDPKSLDRKTQTEIYTTKSPNVIVTALFPGTRNVLPEVAKNILMVRDAMVIFTTPEMGPAVSKIRERYPGNTVIISMNFRQLPLYYQMSNDPEMFWQYQRDLDPEKDLHPNYESYVLSLSRSWFVKEAIRYNPFQSDYFMWADIDSFPTTFFSGKIIISDVQTTSDKILSMARHAPGRQNDPWVVRSAKLCNGKNISQYYHMGSQMIGASNTWIRFHDLFLETLQGYLDRRLFIGQGDSILQSTCLQHRRICVYLLPFMESQTPCSDENHLKFALVHGGKYHMRSAPKLQ